MLIARTSSRNHISHLFLDVTQQQHSSGNSDPSGRDISSADCGFPLHYAVTGAAREGGGGGVYRETLQTVQLASQSVGRGRSAARLPVCLSAPLTSYSNVTASEFVSVLFGKMLLM